MAAVTICSDFGAQKNKVYVNAGEGELRDAAQSLGWEDLLEEGVTTHSSILAWRIPWTEEPDGLWSIGSQSWTRLRRLSVHTCAHAHTHTHTHPPTASTNGIHIVCLNYLL